MSVDPAVLSALSDSLQALRDKPHQPIPTGVISALAEVAKPGTRLKIDLAASAQIGAPLVTVAIAPDAAFLSPLTARQRQVATLIIEGRSNREIAAALGISLGTVKDHVHAVLQRLGLPSRAAVIAASRGGGHRLDRRPNPHNPSKDG